MLDVAKKISKGFSGWGFRLVDGPDETTYQGHVVGHGGAGDLKLVFKGFKPENGLALELHPPKGFKQPLQSVGSHWFSKRLSEADSAAREKGVAITYQVSKSKRPRLLIWGSQPLKVDRDQVVELLNVNASPSSKITVLGRNFADQTREKVRRARSRT